MAEVKVSAGMVFERYEKKYRLPEETYLQLMERLGEYMQADQYTSPELQPGSTYALYINGVKKIEVTLNSGMNVTGDDGGAFTGGYSRGNMVKFTNL